ncbi:MAG: ABC transporter permease [Chloroflexi bacterium]|nr:ABC transporter permease [Chloroflexota bacterium]
MSVRRVAAVAGRIASQFRRDHRSLGLLVAAPILIMSLIGALWGSVDPASVRVVIAGDGATPPAAALTASLSRAAGLSVRSAGLDAAVASLRDGSADAVVVLAGSPRVIVEGSDPTRTSGTLTALTRALAAALGPATPAPPVEYLYGGPSASLLDSLAPGLIAYFGFFFMFLLAAVSFLRERTSGTLERLLASPLTRGELVAGYLAGFTLFALLQAVILIVFTIAVLGVSYRGGIGAIFVVAAGVATIAVALGLLVSAYARNELQAVQFIPLVILPQGFLSGLLVPVDRLPDLLRPLAGAMPLTYAIEALRAVMVKGYPLGDGLVLRDLAIMAAFGVAALVGAALSIRREVA